MFSRIILLRRSTQSKFKKILGSISRPTIGNTMQVDLDLALKFSNRKISYVEKCKLVELVKDDNEKCAEVLPKGRFIVYSGSKPFMKGITNYSEHTTTDVNWISYADLLPFGEEIIKSSVLVDVDENNQPRYSIQIGNLDSSSTFEKDHDGLFFDLRAALFMVSMKSAQLLSRSNALLMFQRNNKFCGKCGSKTERNHSGSSRKCPSCGNTTYPSSNPCGIVLVTDPEKKNALLVRQPRHPPGMFSCIAGFSEVGEPIEETVRREIAEEVGMEVSTLQYVASQHWPFPGSLMMGCYAITEDKEIMMDSKELEKAQWFTREEIGKAIERIEKKPNLMFQSSSEDDGIFIPKPGAIAYHLIKHWYDGTPVNEIYQCIQRSNL